MYIQRGRQRDLHQIPAKYISAEYISIYAVNMCLLGICIHIYIYMFIYIYIYMYLLLCSFGNVLIAMSSSFQRGRESSYIFTFRPGGLNRHPWTFQAACSPQCLWRSHMNSSDAHVVWAKWSLVVQLEVFTMHLQLSVYVANIDRHQTNIQKY